MTAIVCGFGRALEVGAPGGKFGQDGARICDECLDLCLEILAETSSP